MAIAMRNIRNLLLMLLVLTSACALAAESYRITFSIKGIRDTTCLIANYYGNATYIKDTVRVDGSGRCVYTTPASTPHGIYIFVITDKLHFDFIINNDPRFSMESDRSDLQGKMVIKGSPENSLFYRYLAFNRQKYDEIQALQKELRSLHAADSAEVIRKSNEINQEIISYKLDLIRDHPGSFMAFMLDAMKEPAVPQTVEGKAADPSASARYYTQHFWDDTDFTDDRLLRTPVFHNKLQK